MGRRMANKQAIQRKGEVEAHPRTSGLDPNITLAEVLAVVRPALTATFSHDESPDWGARLAAAGTLLAAFPRYLRETPERVRELLSAAVPPELLDAERLDAGRAYRELRAEWDHLDGLRWGQLKGLYVKPYPAYMIAPWENAAHIQASQPTPEGTVRQLPDGRHFLERAGELARLLVEEERM